VAEPKKTVRLAGNGPGKAYTVIKCHNWRGKAIYVYNLQKKALKRIDKPTDEEWDIFTQLGVQVAYPSPDHPSSDVGLWVQFGKEQAESSARASLSCDTPANITLKLTGATITDFARVDILASGTGS
jgi:hypothetical protein